MARTRFHPFTALCCAAVAGSVFLLTAMRPAPGGVTSEQFEILQHMTLVKLPDGLGGQMLTVRFSDVNVQVVNGDGSTDTSDGTGNLIVGYSEDINQIHPRHGSHNLVVGAEHGWTSYGGTVLGRSNNILESYATVTGGTRNTADGTAAHVCGGNLNLASGSHSVAAGGFANEALGQQSVVCGGVGNQTAPGGLYSSILGGTGNEVTGAFSTIGGGDGNTVSALRATISGGCGITNATECSVAP